PLKEATTFSYKVEGGCRCIPYATQGENIGQIEWDEYATIGGTIPGDESQGISSIPFCDIESPHRRLYAGQCGEHQGVISPVMGFGHQFVGVAGHRSYVIETPEHQKRNPHTLYNPTVHIEIIGLLGIDPGLLIVLDGGQRMQQVLGLCQT